jgi:membrane-associated protease RseP (regulator of RpoE activity)
VDDVDLNTFEFDYDLTFMVFFLNTDGKVYARYGGRDSRNADNRQSLAGLHYTMQSVLAMHGRADRSFAPRTVEDVHRIRDGNPRSDRFGGGRGRCMHCHQVKEQLNAELKAAGKWDRQLIWRYPLPENIGIVLDVDRGNVVKEIPAKSQAAAAGLRVGDQLGRMAGVPIHSIADAQFALDHAPAAGNLEILFQRGDSMQKATVALEQGWRKTDVSWRPSMRRMLPSARLYGDDLTAEEKKALSLSPTHLAFRQKDSVPTQAKIAGIQPGDIILGLDDEKLEMDVTEFQHYVRRTYLIGDKPTVNVLRAGKRLRLAMTLMP